MYMHGIYQNFEVLLAPLSFTQWENTTTIVSAPLCIQHEYSVISPHLLWCFMSQFFTILQSYGRIYTILPFLWWILVSGFCRVNTFRKTRVVLSNMRVLMMTTTTAAAYTVVSSALNANTYEWWHSKSMLIPRQQNTQISCQSFWKHCSIGIAQYDDNDRWWWTATWKMFTSTSLSCTLMQHHSCLFHYIP